MASGSSASTTINRLYINSSNRGVAHLTPSDKNPPHFQAAFNFDRHSVAIYTLIARVHPSPTLPHFARQKSSTDRERLSTRPRAEHRYSKAIVDGACRGGLFVENRTRRCSGSMEATQIGRVVEI